MRVCWNWQTGTFEGRVFRRTGSSPVTRTTFFLPNRASVDSLPCGKMAELVEGARLEIV